MPTRNTPGDCAAILQCSLLGSPQIAWQGTSLPITRRQVRALLYVLASDLRPAPRDRLAFLLWPDEADATARRNLIRVLSYARQLLPRPDLLLSDNTAVALNPALVASDAVRFSDLCAGNHAADWEMASSIYRGRLLDGFSLADSPEFDAWLGQAQRRFERAYLELLRKLLAAKSEAGDIATAIGYARCYLAVDELAEEIHRQLITLYARQHDRRAALHQFEQCANVLERELGVHPLPETRAAYEAVHSGASVTAPPSTPVWTTLPGLTLPLIGREQEWDLLATACRQHRRGGVILIDGEAGVGKSRLMQEVATAQGVLTLSGANHAASQSLPYQPLSQALRQALALHERWRRIAPIWLAELTRLLPEIATQFAGLPPVVATAPQQAQTRLLEALTQAFFGLAGDSPLLLCLDDVHWADEATLGWLAYVSNRLSGSGLCILAAYRAVDAERLADWQAGLSRAGVVTRVPVAGLPEAAVLELLRRASDQSGRQALAARIHAATGGNAFFVMETIRELLAMGNRPDSHADLPLPQTVREAVLRRVGRLTPLTQQLLAMAAVLSPHLHFVTLLESAGRSELETVDGVEELLAHQLLRTDGDGFRFQHELARHAVYEEISPWRRRLLHRRAGESLAHLPTVDQVGLLAAIAHHFAAAGDAQQAIVYFQRAATHAQELLVYQEATAYLDKAIALAQAHEAAEGVLPALYTALGDTLISAGNFARAETAYRNALSQVGRDALLEWAILQHKMAETLPPQQRSAEAVTLRRDALARLEREDSQPGKALRLDLLLGLMGALYYQLAVDEMAALEAPVRMLLAEVGAPGQRIHFFGLLDEMAVIRERYRLSIDTVALSRNALRAAEDAGDPWQIAHLRFGLGFNLLWHGDLNGTEPVLHAALTQAQQLNDQWRQMQCLAYLTILHRLQGDVAGVELRLSQLEATGQSLEIPFYQAVLHANHAWLQHRNGRFHLAQQEALTALALWKDHPYPFQWLAQWVVLAVALRQGALADAVQAACDMLDPKQQRLPDDVADALKMAVQTTESLPTEATKDHLLQAMELARGCGYL